MAFTTKHFLHTKQENLTIGCEPGSVLMNGSLPVKTLSGWSELVAK